MLRSIYLAFPALVEDRQWRSPGRVQDGRVVQSRGPGGGGEPPRLSQVFSPMWWW